MTFKSVSPRSKVSIMMEYRFVSNLGANHRFLSLTNSKNVRNWVNEGQDLIDPSDKIQLAYTGNAKKWMGLCLKHYMFKVNYKFLHDLKSSLSTFLVEASYPTVKTFKPPNFNWPPTNSSIHWINKLFQKWDNKSAVSMSYFFHRNVQQFWTPKILSKFAIYYKHLLSNIVNTA